MNDEGKTSADFWRTHLAGSQQLHLPSSPSEQDDQVARGTTHHETLCVEHADCLADSTIIAAWALTLSIHCLTEDVVFGVSCQEAWPGALPFRVHVPDGHTATVAGIVANVERSIDNIVASRPDHESLARIQALGPEYEESCKVSTCLELTTSDQPPDSSAQLSYPLVISCAKGLKSTRLHLAADLSAHTRNVCSSILRHFRTALKHFLAQPDTPIAEIPLAVEADLRSIEEWTCLPEQIPSQPLLHKLVEEQAQSRPLEIAVAQTDSVMTYGELNHGADALAMHLLGLVGPGQRQWVGNVAVVFSKSSFAVLAMLAVLKAGGTFVPIDPHSPAARMHKMLSNTQATIVLCSENHQSLLEATLKSIPVLAVTPRTIYDLKKAARENAFHPAFPPTCPETPAYIMHTSGSTGQPKGIPISHQSITTALSAMARYFSASDSMYTCQFNAFTFDVSMADIWLTLTHGGRICMPTDDERFLLDDFIPAQRSTFFLATPSVVATLDPTLARTHLTTLATIGEKVKPSFLHRYAPRRSSPSSTSSDDSPGFTLRDTWGPTEASVIATGSSPITLSHDGKTLSQRAGNIGCPIGCTVFLVSPHDPHTLSPLYAPGEIAIVGPTLAKGYLNDETSTAAAFRTDLEWTKDRRWVDKLGEETMARVYLTGDIGRYSEEGDGQVVFMYRKGGYVKVNGLRIDPGEVEGAIGEVGRRYSDGLCWEKSIVCVVEKAFGGVDKQSLVCFVPESDREGPPGRECERREGDSAQRESSAKMTKELKDSIPEYMVPELFVPVANIPVTTSSKLDKKGLLATLDALQWDEMVDKYSPSNEEKLL